MRPTREDLEEHVEEWSRQLDRKGCGWWPRYVYHYTDVTNAISILNDGELLCRERALEEGCMRSDNADPAVIDQTDPEHLQFVRLYFRPRTPPQANVEGIIRKGRRKTGHCPAPVFFLFDLVEVLLREDTRFSKGTMASHRYGHSDRREYFKSIPFEDVYHDEGLGILETRRKREIIQSRMAEVLVTDELPLGPELRAVFCRSPAERQTLLYGLSTQALNRFYKVIREGYDKTFFRFHPYVQNVTGSDGNLITVELYKSDFQPLSAKLRFRTDSGKTLGWDGDFPARHKKFTYRLPGSYTGGVLDYRLEGCWGYHGDVVLGDLPF